MHVILLFIWFSYHWEVFTFSFLWLACKKSGYYLTDVFQFSFSNWPWCCKFGQWRRSKNYRFAGLPWDFSIQVSNANDEVIYHCSSRELPKSSCGIVCCPPTSRCQSYCTDISSSKIYFSHLPSHYFAFVLCFQLHLLYFWHWNFTIPCCNYAYYAKVFYV